MKAQRIIRRSLHEEILDQITGMIVAGRWGPSELIAELPLCEELGVSRTPLREALKVLSAEGLVEVKQRSGAQIRVLSPNESAELFETTGLIEAAAAHQLVSRASDGDITEIEALHQKMMRTKATGDRSAYFELNQKIHTSIVAMAKNSELTAIHNRLLLRMRRIRFACTNDDAEWDAATVEHDQLLEALKKRDGAALAVLLQDHMKHGWERVRDFVVAEYAQVQNSAQTANTSSKLRGNR
jgi:DNA-binding GntR family transcriptional regulator